MKSSQKGFTLIELVVVIVILGILAATALPKFIDLSTDARAAVVQGVEGSMRSANSMIYAKAATQGQMGATGKVTIASETIVDTIDGFAATTAALVSAMDLDANKIDSNTTGVFYAGKAVTTCGVAYTIPVTAAGATAAKPPAYTTVITGC